MEPTAYCARLESKRVRRLNPDPNSDPNPDPHPQPGGNPGDSHGKINQDRGCLCYPFGMHEGIPYKQALFCVYDGHGPSGEKASEYVMNHVQADLEKHPTLVGLG